jgi:cellobiose-specific phosphotransferase system component IIA
MNSKYPDPAVERAKELVRQSEKELEKFRKSKAEIRQLLEQSRRNLSESLKIQYQLIKRDPDDGH